MKTINKTTKKTTKNINTLIFSKYDLYEAGKKANISATALSVFNYLVGRRNDETGKCFPSVKTIAKEIKRHKRTVQRAFLELVKAGLLIKKECFRKDKGQTSNQYDLVSPASQENVENSEIKAIESEKTLNIEILTNKEKELNTSDSSANLSPFKSDFYLYADKFEKETKIDRTKDFFLSFAKPIKPILKSAKTLIFSLLS